MTQLGRITGPLLEANLIRNGQDLSFRNFAVNDDLLYLNAGSSKININTNGSYDLNVLTTIRSTNLIAPDTSNIARFSFANSTVTTTTGPIEIFPEVSMARMQVADLDFNGTKISNKAPNGAISLDPNGSGIVEVFSNSTINGDLSVLGRIGITGDLSTASRLIIGDNIFDTVTIAPDFTQDILPGDNLTYDLGKANKRWKNAFVHSDSKISNLVETTITVSEQLFFDGPNAVIRTLQSNDDILLNPTTEITTIERIQFYQNDITNLDATVLPLGSTGIGYTRFVDNTAVVIPAGSTAQRPYTEIGETRWNTDLNYLECFDGTVYQVATGGGQVVSEEDMNDLGNLYALILG